MRPVLCLITDRRRLVATLGQPLASWEPLLLGQIQGAIDGGIDVIQIREPDLDAGILTRVVRQCLELAAGSKARIVVNDRLDVALAALADGVHLREDSLPAGSVRRLAPAALVGRSIHSAEAVKSAGPVDYLIAGTVFETASKPGARAGLGLNGLRAVVEQAGTCPVWAIGGVSAERMPLIARSGAQGIAAIGAFIPTQGAAEIAAEVQKLTMALRFSFDTPGGLS